MARSILLTGETPVLPDAPPHPGPNATVAEHAAWSKAFANYCGSHARFALALNLESYWRWRQAERLARFAAEVWAERAVKEAS